MVDTVEWTTQRTLTRRGVLWLGLKCDVRCKFCYDELVSAENKRWMPLTEAAARLDRFRQLYRNEYVDFMGGEPTMHPEILGIVRHAASIGLRPTIITHGMHLANPDRCAAYADAGLHDVLLSVHGLGDTARQIHGRGRDNHAKQLAAIANMRRVGLPFRFNVTLIRDNLDQLADIARLAVDQGARVVNFLTFNPYFEWSQQPEIEFQARHSEIAGPLSEAISICTDGGVEANVRYMPICQLPGLEQHVYTGFQLPWDQHEWDYNSWYEQQAPTPADPAWYLQASREQQSRHHYQHVAGCTNCSLRNVCDGFHAQYVARWGGDEARPYPGSPTQDPTVHITRQRKVEYSTPPAAEPAARPTRTLLPLIAGARIGPTADGRAGHTHPRHTP